MQEPDFLRDLGRVPAKGSTKHLYSKPLTWGKLSVLLLVGTYWYAGTTWMLGVALGLFYVWILTLLWEQRREVSRVKLITSAIMMALSMIAGWVAGSL